MIDKLKNRFVTGAWLTDVKHYFSKINEIVDWINNIGTPKYKIYSAILNQTLTDAPVATVLENNLGITPTWNYFAVGTYYTIATGTFITDKTVLITGTPGNPVFIKHKMASEDKIDLLVYDTNGTLSNNRLTSTYVEIRVCN